MDSEVKKLHNLVLKGNADVIEALLAASHNKVDLINSRDSKFLNSRDSKSSTALHKACEVDLFNIVQVLVKHKADIHAEDESGNTPLHIAVVWAGESTIQILLQNGAETDILKQNWAGHSPLSALVRDDNNLKVFKLLCYESLDAPESEGDTTSFHIGLGLKRAKKTHLRIRPGVLEVIKGQYTGSCSGRTLLHDAAYHNANKMAQQLIIMGVDIDARDIHNDTPLHIAAKKGSNEVIETLMKNRASVFLANRNRQIPMELGGVKAICRVLRESPQLNQEFKIATTITGSNGARVVHYVACHGTKEDMKWLLQKLRAYVESENYVYSDMIYCYDNNGKTPLHWAATYKNVDVLQAFVEEEVIGDSQKLLHEDKKRRTPLSCALKHTDLKFAEAFLELLPSEKQVDGFKRWARLIIKKKKYEEKLKMMLPNIPSPKFRERGGGGRGESESKPEPEPEPDSDSDSDSDLDSESESDSESGSGSGSEESESKLEAEKQKQKQEKERKTEPRVRKIKEEDLLHEIMTPFYIALRVGRTDIAELIQKHTKYDVINAKGRWTGRTVLHWATLLNKRGIVSILCRDDKFQAQLVANEEDDWGKTSLQYAKEMNFMDIWKELMDRNDVKSHVDGLYRDRQVSVDATNAILVGAALIASVTFAGWLQPPIGDIKQQYPGHVGIRVFWIFNSLSFLFAITTVLTGAAAVLPNRNIYIAIVVFDLERRLAMTAFFFSLSIVFVIGAFVAAGIVVLPSVLKSEANMISTTIIGGISCLYGLKCFLVPLYRSKSLFKELNSFQKNFVDVYIKSATQSHKPNASATIDLHEPSTRTGVHRNARGSDSNDSSTRTELHVNDVSTCEIDADANISGIDDSNTGLHIV